MKLQKHARRMGEGIGILLIIFAVYELTQLVFRQDATIIYILATMAILMLCYFVGAIIEE